MSKHTTNASALFVGMAVHRELITVAYALEELGGEATLPGSIGTRQWDLDEFIRQLKYEAQHVVFVYEAGSGSYYLYRYLRERGLVC